MPSGHFFANRPNESKSQSVIAARPLPKSPVSSSPYDVVPQMSIRSPHVRPGKFAIGDAKRFLQQNLPKSDLCVDGDLGLTTRSEAALEPPRFSYAHWQAYICPSSSLVMVPGLHPMGVARLLVIPPAVAVPGAARVVGPHCVVRGATN